MRTAFNPVAMLRLPGGPNEIVGIQFMRYVAALAVLVDHFIVVLYENGRVPHDVLAFAYKLGEAGVLVFFAISGFVMMLTNRGKFHVPGSATDFLVRRLIRIWPMYFLATITVFVMKYGTDYGRGIESLIKSLTFVPYAGPNGLYRPVLGKGWTLNYEMFFYAVFAAGLRFRKPTGLLIVGLVLLGLGLNDGAGRNELVHFYANGIVLYFLTGIMLGYLVKETRIKWVHPRSAEAAVSLAIFGFATLLAVTSYASPGAGKQAAMLSLTFVCLYCVCFARTRFSSARLSSIAALLGDSSYCLYLFHGFVFFAVKPVLKYLPETPLTLLLVLLAGAASGACLLIHLCIEAPLNRALLRAYKKMFPIPRQTAAPPVSDP